MLRNRLPNILAISMSSLVPIYCWPSDQALDISIDELALKYVEEQYGPEARVRVAHWGKLMDDDRRLSDENTPQKLLRANDYFNEVRWLFDPEHWGQEDYWATPVETLATNGGDCEDFAIGKYFSLLGARVSNDKLRITYVKSVTYNLAHMVLAYYPTPDAEPLILDNINGTILPSSQRDDLIPVYSFSGDSLWLAKEKGKKLGTSSYTGLPKWKQVNQRFREQLLLPNAR